MLSGEHLKREFVKLSVIKRRWIAMVTLKKVLHYLKQSFVEYAVMMYGRQSF